MTPRAFVIDRLPLLLAFWAGLLIIILVLHLSTGPLRLGDVLYGLLLAAVFTAVILGVDYVRHRRFRRAFGRLLAGDLNAVLPPGANREQRAVHDAFEALRRSSLGRLKESEIAAEQHRVFIDQWVHQMKTPLAVLDLSVQSGEGAEELRETIASASESLHQGLQTMLSIARLERFELDLKPATVELAGLVRSEVNDLKASWIRAGVYPRVVGRDAGFSVQTDAKWLQVVLRQLLTNAIKYCERGGEVVVSIAQDGEDTLLSVRDQGIGIPEEDLPRVFDRFFTGHNGRLRPAATGMGLHLAASICERLGHGLSVESRVGHGSTFTVTFRPRSLTQL